jgi:ABC-type Fe3+-hydroxamate transport system substrate-binding protein
MTSNPGSGPRRIVCLTEETTETLYLLGEEGRIAGISGFTYRPLRARREKPKVSAFTSANIDKIIELRPDLVLGFSDLQADIARDLIRHGVNVLVFNQRSMEEILEMVLMLSRIVAAEQSGWGRKVNKQKIRGREGWESMAAVRNAHVYEVKSTYILQPGPAGLTEGVRQLHAILAAVAGCNPDRALAPAEAVDPDLRRNTGEGETVQ